MLQLAVRFPALVVVGSLVFNVFTFFVALQQGRISMGSLRFLLMQAATLPAALKGDLMPWLQIQGT